MKLYTVKACEVYGGVTPQTLTSALDNTRDYSQASAPLLSETNDMKQSSTNLYVVSCLYHRSYLHFNDINIISHTESFSNKLFSFFFARCFKVSKNDRLYFYLF